jgi:SagB-type dehydrogenase family enzyme
MTWREYHDATKHTPELLRRNTHRLDWSNMPDPFRHYEGAPVLDLPADPPPPEVAAMDLLNGACGRTSVEDGPEFLSQLFFHSASISATKVVPSTGYRYALRVNPSSGNLHPTEFHFCTSNLRGWADGLYHYRPSSHMAEQRLHGNVAQQLGVTAPIAIILTSIAWREAWKYQNRAYRYCLLDVGHAWQAVALAARAMNCVAIAHGHFADDFVAGLCKLASDEWPMLIVTITGAGVPLRAGEQGQPTVVESGAANALSKIYVPYPSIDAIHQGTKLPTGTVLRAAPGESVGRTHLRNGKPFGKVVRGRRSALDFEGGDRSITRDQLLAMLGAAAPHTIELFVYLHRVMDLQPGLYKFVRGGADLEVIRAGDQRVAAAALSLQQDLAGNACYAISMMAPLERLCAKHGPRGYRYAHFEAGAIGQRLYVAAEALGLRATGIGAFFDDEVHKYLGLSAAPGEVVYHFAVGYPVVDTRLEALA